MAKARKELTGEKKRKEKKEKFVSFIDHGLKVGEVSKLFKSNRSTVLSGPLDQFWTLIHNHTAENAHVYQDL